MLGLNTLLYCTYMLNEYTDKHHRLSYHLQLDQTANKLESKRNYRHWFQLLWKQMLSLNRLFYCTNEFNSWTDTHH